jgi:hypothetical protein
MGGFRDAARKTFISDADRRAPVFLSSVVRSQIESKEDWSMPLLPSTPLPYDYLHGELGGKSLSLVEELNALAAAHEELRDEFDNNEANDASEGQLAAAVSFLDDKIDDNANSANSAMVAATDLLRNQLVALDGAAEGYAHDYAGNVEEGLREEIASVSDDIWATVEAGTKPLRDQAALDFVELSSQAAGYASAVESALVDLLDDAQAHGASQLAGEVKDLNDRIGTLYEVGTDSSTPVVLATISVPQHSSVRITARIQGHQKVEGSVGVESVAYLVEAFCRALPSIGTLTVSGIPADGDQIEIGGVTYTWKDTPAAAFDVQRNAGSAETNIDNMVAAITLTGTPGTEYHADTTIHPAASARKASASTMEAVAKVPGTGGDSITTTDPTDVGAVLSWAAGTLGSGSDMDVNVIGNTATDYESAGAGACDKSISAGTGENVEIKVTGLDGFDFKWIGEVHVVELSK